MDRRRSRPRRAARPFPRVKRRLGRPSPRRPTAALALHLRRGSNRRGLRRPVELRLPHPQDAARPPPHRRPRLARRSPGQHAPPARPRCPAHRSRQHTSTHRLRCLDRQPARHLPVVYRALVRRANNIADTIKFAVRLADPIARTGEQFATVAGGNIDLAPDLSDLTIIGPPQRTIMTFTSSVPLVAPLDGSYLIRVTATFKKTLPFLPAPVRTLNLASGDVPTKFPPPAPAPSLALIRSLGPGPLYTYTAQCFGLVVGFEVNVSAHDGRVVTKTKVVS